MPYRNLKRRSARGQAMVEMALLLVLFLGILIGIMDWSWTMYAHESMVSRAARAARWIAVRPFDTNVASAQDIVLYGVTPCAGCTPAFGLTAANVTVTRVPVAAPNTGIVNGVAEPGTEHVVVTISGHNITHFTPFFSNSTAARTITASQLYECLDLGCTAP